MQIHVLIASILLVVFVLLCTLIPGILTYDGQEVRYPFVRTLLAVLVWLVVGVIFWIIGVIGSFLLSPFADLFHVLH